ncbi:unnamed protein product [Ectocarpus sp. 6 AP-2014]
MNAQTISSTQHPTCIHATPYSSRPVSSVQQTNTGFFNFKQQKQQRTYRTIKLTKFALLDNTTSLSARYIESTHIHSSPILLQHVDRQSEFRIQMTRDRRTIKIVRPLLGAVLCFPERHSHFCRLIDSGAQSQNPPYNAHRQLECVRHVGIGYFAHATATRAKKAHTICIHKPLPSFPKGSTRYTTFK